jgi:choline dehydrogenase
MYEPWMDPISPTGFTLMAGMVRPQSRGTIRLAGRDPSDGLLIDAHALEAQEDIDMILAAIDIVRSIGEAGPLVDGWDAMELYPGPDVRSVEELTEYIRRTAITYHHQVGTARWASTSRRSSTRASRSMAWRACASPMPRSCRRSRPGTRTRRP